jgi:tetratricopeptide (TPR) repeat protein
VLRAALAFGLAALLLQGCATKSTKPERPTAPTKTPATQPAPEPVKPADKGDPEGRFAEALALMKQKKAPEAEAAFLALSKDFPEFSGPQTNLGILLAKSGRRDQAIAAFTRAATANGQNASAFNWIGIVNREAGQYERAREAYEKAISIKPDYAAAHLNLGLLLEDHLKRPADAVQKYRDYFRLTGNKDLRVLPWIAEVEARQAKAEAAPVTPAKPATPAENEVK